MHTDSRKKVSISNSISKTMVRATKEAVLLARRLREAIRRMKRTLS